MRAASCPTGSGLAGWSPGASPRKGRGPPAWPLLQAGTAFPWLPSPSRRPAGWRVPRSTSSLVAQPLPRHSALVCASRDDPHVLTLFAGSRGTSCAPGKCLRAVTRAACWRLCLWWPSLPPRARPCGVPLPKATASRAFQINDTLTQGERLSRPVHHKVDEAPYLHGSVQVQVR